MFPLSSNSMPMQVPQLNGTTPGLLDPTQVTRLLTAPTSTLIFASFNPRTAAGLPQNLNHDRIALQESRDPARRIVIEITITGDKFWRFVPRAKRDEGVLDEGSWPRVVEICGNLYECSQEQWDIYKLDPFYECRVRMPPALTIIIPIKPQPPEPEQVGERRKIVTDDQSMPPPKRVHIVEVDSEDEDDEIEVEGMIIDDPPPQPAPQPQNSARVKRKHGRHSDGSVPQTDEEDDEEDDEDNYRNPAYDRRRAQTSPPKRKYGAFVSTNTRRLDSTYDEQSLRNSPDFTEARYKRTRTVSPTSTKRDLDAKRLKRVRKKTARRKSDIDSRARSRDSEFLQSVYYDAHEHVFRQFERTDSIPSVVMDDDISLPPSADDYEHAFSDFQPSPTPPPPPEDDDDTDSDCTEVPDPEPEKDEEGDRAAKIAESRRKLAELEKDRPLWEEAARRRKFREQAQHYSSKSSESRRAREAEAARAREEAEARAKAEEARAKQREEALRREQYEQARLRRRRQLEQLHQRWHRMIWTPEAALDRYNALSEIFDSTKYNLENPICFDEVPWPVLEHPRGLSIENIDWNAVEVFFTEVKPFLQDSQYRVLVEKSHKRFHPDRWRSRGILKSIVDEAERACLEVASNTVAQALTPLWTELTGR